MVDRPLNAKGQDMPDATLVEIEDQSLEFLRAEVVRMAASACKAAERTALDGIDAALGAACEAGTSSADRARELAAQLQTQAEIMQTEIGRFLAIARGRLV